MSLRPGTWWVRSKSDPRWNTDGRGDVGMFSHRQAEAWIKQMTPILGNPPDDLDVGYMKD